MNRHMHHQPPLSGGHSSSSRSAPTGSHASHRVSTRGPQKPPPDTEGGFSGLFSPLPLTMLLTLGVGLVSLTLAAGLAYATPDPTRYMTPCAYGALALTSLVGGILAGVRGRPGSVLAGLVSGGLWALLLTIVAAVLPSPAPISPVMPWLARLFVIALHLLGAWLTRPRPKAPAHTAGGHHASHHG